MQSRVFQPSLHYYYIAGHRNGCRELMPSNQETEELVENSSVDSEYCDKQCVFDGSYCVQQGPEELPDGIQGKDVMNEIIRRMCLEEHISAADPRFFD
jgi:hypothetical protein